MSDPRDHIESGPGSLFDVRKQSKIVVGVDKTIWLPVQAWKRYAARDAKDGAAGERGGYEGGE